MIASWQCQALSRLTQGPYISNIKSNDFWIDDKTLLCLIYNVHSDILTAITSRYLSRWSLSYMYGVLRLVIQKYACVRDTRVINKGRYTARTLDILCPIHCWVPLHTGVNLQLIYCDCLEGLVTHGTIPALVNHPIFLSHYTIHEYTSMAIIALRQVR